MTGLLSSGADSAKFSSTAAGEALNTVGYSIPQGNFCTTNIEHSGEQGPMGRQGGGSVDLCMKCAVDARLLATRKASGKVNRNVCCRPQTAYIGLSEPWHLASCM